MVILANRIKQYRERTHIELAIDGLNPSFFSFRGHFRGHFIPLFYNFNLVVAVIKQG